MNQKNGNRTQNQKHAESALVVEMALGETVMQELDRALTQQKAEYGVFVAGAASIPNSTLTAKLTKCPVGYWCRPNANATKFAIGLYESGAHKPTGLPIGTFDTKQAALAFAVDHKQKAEAVISARLAAIAN